MTRTFFDTRLSSSSIRLAASECQKNPGGEFFMVDKSHKSVDCDSYLRALGKVYCTRNQYHVIFNHLSRARRRNPNRVVRRCGFARRHIPRKETKGDQEDQFNCSPHRAEIDFMPSSSKQIPLGVIHDRIEPIGDNRPNPDRISIARGYAFNRSRRRPSKRALTCYAVAATGSLLLPTWIRLDRAELETRDRQFAGAPRRFPLPT